MDDIERLAGRDAMNQAESEARLSGIRQAVRLLRWLLVVAIYLMVIVTLNVFAHALGWWPS